MKLKYYAIRKGHTTGVYFGTWEQVKSKVNGFAGAEYKSFSDVYKAQQYILEEEYKEDVPDTYYAYVDGSNFGDGSAYSGSCVIVYNGEIIDESNLRGENPDFLPKRNIAGEIMGALLAISWAQKNNITQLFICHDYNGVGKWATGEFKARDSLSIMYKQQVDNSIAGGLDLKFIKVKGHSGHEYNERADVLAKEALGIGK